MADFIDKREEERIGPIPKNPNAGHVTADAGANYTITASWTNFATEQTEREVTTELTTDQKELTHLMRALCALNPEVFGNSLTVNGPQIDEYIHTAVTVSGVTALTVPKTLKWELDPLYAPPPAPEPETTGVSTTGGAAGASAGNVGGNGGSKYFNLSEFACPCCGTLPANGIDSRLLQVLDAMRESTGQPLSIISGYRCAKHNAECGGASHSYHMEGCAADVDVPAGMSVDQLASVAINCGGEGIGRYYNHNFVHVDTRGYSAAWTNYDYC